MDKESSLSTLERQFSRDESFHIWEALEIFLLTCLLNILGMMGEGSKGNESKLNSMFQNIYVLKRQVLEIKSCDLWENRAWSCNGWL